MFKTNFVVKRALSLIQLSHSQYNHSNTKRKHRYGVSQDSLRKTLERYAFEEEKMFELEMIENRKENVSDLRHVKAEQMRWILSSATRFQIEIQSSQIDASEIIRNYTISHFGTERSLLERFSEEQDMMLGYLTNLSDDEHVLLLEKIQSEFVLDLRQSCNLVSCVTTMLDATKCAVTVNSKWIGNIITRFCEMTRQFNMSSVHSRVAAIRYTIQTLRLILLCM